MKVNQQQRQASLQMRPTFKMLQLKYVDVIILDAVRSKNAFIIAFADTLI